MFVDSDTYVNYDHCKDIKMGELITITVNLQKIIKPNKLS